MGPGDGHGQVQLARGRARGGAERSEPGDRQASGRGACGECQLTLAVLRGAGAARYRRVLRLRRWSRPKRHGAARFSQATQALTWNSWLCPREERARTGITQHIALLAAVQVAAATRVPKAKGALFALLPAPRDIPSQPAPGGPVPGAVAAPRHSVQDRWWFAGSRLRFRQLRHDRGSSGRFGGTGPGACNCVMVSISCARSRVVKLAGNKSEAMR